MENKITAMQIMLYELKHKQIIYEQSGMREAAAALVTSIETAEELLSMEKEQITDAYGDGLNAYRTDFCNREEYYNKTYGN